MNSKIFYHLYNNFYKCVSTIPDECKGVGLEISTNSKREAIILIMEHIVSSNGNI